MANPVELLHTLFVSWSSKPTSTVADARNDPQLKEHRRAVGYLDSVGQLLDRMDEDGKRTTIYRNHFPTWVRMVFNYPHQWQQASKSTINQTAIDHLETLIDYAEDYSPKVDINKLPILDLYLEAARCAINDDDSLSTDVKHVALRVIQNVQSLIDEIDSVDSTDFEKALLELLSALALTVIKSRNQGRWEGWINGFVWPFAYDSAKGGVTNLWELLQTQGIPLMLGQ